jgi:hypothetical protein
MNAAIAVLLLATAQTAETTATPAAERAEAAASSEGGRSETPERWSSFLPLMADEARKRGVELPLPFGASLVYYHLERDIRITDVRIGRGGSPPTSVSELAQFSSTSRVDNLNLKLDAWIFPFLNVYGLVGWFKNASTTRVHVGIPGRGPLPPVTRDLEVPTTLEGSVEGLGVTLAGGFPPFFLVVDLNAFVSDLGFDDKLRGSIASVRSGYAGSVAGMPINVWLSATYWNTTTTVKSSVSDPVLGEIAFEADQGPRWMWTYGVGGNLRVHPHFELFTEGGVDFHGGWYFVLGPVARL